MKGLSLAVVMTLLMAVPGGAQESASIQPDTLVQVSDSIWFGQGLLENSDRTFDKDNRAYHYDVWPFYAQVGDQLNILVESTDFDSMVVLLSLTDEGTAFEAANTDINDDLTDSLITVDVMRDSEFVVLVVPQHGDEQGEYTLSLRSRSLLGSAEQQEDLNRVLDQAVELNEVLLEIHKYPLF